MTNPSTHQFFATCAPGLEPILADEFRSLGISGRSIEGGVEFRGTEDVLHRICLFTRVAESARLKLSGFEARDFKALEAGVRKLPLRAFLEKGTRVRVKAVCHQSKLYHSGAVKERVESVLADYVGLDVIKSAAALDDDEDAAHESGLLQVIHVRVSEDEVVLSLDAGGERLHRRGYRTHVHSASLRETLAAAVVRVAWAARPTKGLAAPVLWHPFCRAGTIALEALHMAHGGLAGEQRSHNFERWRSFDRDAYVALKSKCVDEAKAAAFCPALTAWASDREEKAVEAARQNSALAGFDSMLTLRVGDVTELAREIPEGAFIVTNPPYGKRVAEAKATQKLLTVLGTRPDLTPVVALVGGAARDTIPKKCPALFRTKNGGVPVSARRIKPAE